jgi:hypothetical protein
MLSVTKSPPAEKFPAGGLLLIKRLRECFLSPNIMQEKSINHREHGVHRVFKGFLRELCDLCGKKGL